MATHDLLLTLRGHEGVVYQVAWSPDGQYLAYASGDDVNNYKADHNWHIKVIDAKTHREIISLPTGFNALAVAWSLESRRLATGTGRAGTVHVWDVLTRKEILKLSAHQDRVRSVAWSPDGRLLATASDDHTAKVWDMATGKQLHSFAHSGKLDSVAWSPDGRRLTSPAALRW